MQQQQQRAAALKDSFYQQQQEQLWQSRGVSEFTKMGQSQMLTSTGSGGKIEGMDLNPLAKSSYMKNRQSGAVQQLRHQSEYNQRWGATQYKVVRDVDTSGGKYQ